MCDSWLRNKEVNPLTNRPIKIGSEMYRDIENFCGNKDDNCLQIRSNRNINPLTKKALAQNSKKADLFLGLCETSRKVASRKSVSKKVASRKPVSKKGVVCKDDEEINQATGRCRKKCKDNEERNQETGRCKKVASRKPVSRKVASRKVASRKVASRKVASRKPVSRKVKELISDINPEKEKKEAVKEAKKANDVEVIENNEMVSPLQCTKYKTVTLKDHQKKVCAYIDKNPTNKGMILFHSVGSGKTLTAITIIRCLLKHFPKKKVFVVTPKSLVDNFKKEVKKVGVDLGANVNLITHVKFINKINEEGAGFCRNSIIIVDEAHNFRSGIGLRARTLMKGTSIASHVFLLTATPVFNHPREFTNLYCMVSNNEHKTEEYKNIFTSFMINQSKIRNFLKNKISYFKNDDTTEYPSVSYHNVEFEMTEEYYGMYSKIEENNLLDEERIGFWRNAIELIPFYNGVRRAVNAVDEVIPTPKVEWVVRKIKEHIRENKKILLYSNWLKSGTSLVQKRLKEEGIKFEEIKGDMSIPKRTQAVNKYNSGEIKLLSISSAGGEGLDLKETRTVIIMEPHWNNEKLNQVIGRAVRFRSHSGLPLEERHVDIYNLILQKSEEHINDEHPSVDQMLVQMGKEKNILIDAFYNVILDASL